MLPKETLSFLCYSRVMKRRMVVFSLFCVGLLMMVSGAQDSGADRTRIRQRIMDRFDKDGDGSLSESEREELRRFVQQRRGGRSESDPGVRGAGRMEEAKPTMLTTLYGESAPRVELEAKNFELKDQKRDKTLPFRATFPADAKGKLPVIVWSHGLYGSQDFYRPLVDHWARHGYLVLQPSHSDSRLRGSGLSNPTSEWNTRPEDVSFLLDSIPQHPQLKTLADMSRIGMGGHSFGAHTTLLVDGAVPRFGQTYTDPRPLAFVAISPQSSGALLDQESWAGIKRPTLFISGDNDKTRQGEEAANRRDAYNGATPGQKYLLWVKDAYHNFGGISGVSHSRSGPANGDQLALVKSCTLAFWDKYLKASPEATRLIDSGAYNASSRGLAKWSER